MLTNHSSVTSMVFLNNVLARCWDRFSAHCFVALAFTLLFQISTAQAENRDEFVYFFNDALGSAVAAVNERGELCWTEQYTPYGDKTINDDLVNARGCGIVGEERGFTGHTEDVNSDLVYMQQRYYDPSIGRFLSVDPQDVNPDDPKTYNRYAYGNNNPYKYTDPDGELAFLVPIAVFLAKEAVAELASRATDGATDFLSFRRMGTKVAKTLGKALKGNCTSFSADMQVLTADGYRPIVDIEPGVHEVWSKDEASGQLSLQPVLEAFYSHYDEAVYLQTLDHRTGKTQTIVSNTLHPYFIQRDDTEKSGELRHVAYRPNEVEIPIYKGSIENGHWMEAADLLAGDQLLNVLGQWVNVVAVERIIEPLTAFNMEVANTHTYFVAGADELDKSEGVWVHNAKCGSGGVAKGANEFVYRGGSGTPTNLTPRPKDVGGLSGNTNPMPGKNQVIDTSKLNQLCAVCDNPKTGHVSIKPKEMNQMQDWIDSRGSGTTHPLTQELMNAVVDQIKR